MGEAQKLPYDELLRAGARGVRGRHRPDGRGRGGVRAPRPARRSRSSTGSRRCKAAAAGTPVDEHLVGELIASEVEVRTGRCETLRRGGREDGRAPRRSSPALADALGIALGATGTHPWSRWQDQRIIDTPHYRRNDELLRYVVWRNNTFGLHVHVGIRGADRAIAVHDGLRPFLPHLLALSASSPLVEGVNSGLHSARTRDLHAHVPALRRARPVRRLGRVRGLRAPALRDRLDRRAHAALVERPPAPRLPDRRDPDLRRAARPRRGASAGGASPTPSPRGSRVPSTRASRSRSRRRG